MADAELLFEPATGLAARVRAGELSAPELVALSLARIDELDGELNAFVDVYADEALAAAAKIGPSDPRPFAGVPIAIKNNRAVAGRRLTNGAELTGDWAPAHDHAVVRRLRGAGFVVIGSTTLPEWGILPWTNTRRSGATRNPWDLGRTSGGSSGGSGAAVAAGMVPLAHANDGGGSTRIPAACCGLVGLKAQRHRVSLAPDAGESFLAVDGVLTRTVADTAAVLDVLAGPELGDAAWAPPPCEPFAQAAARAPAPARIALVLDAPRGSQVGEAERAGTLAAGELLRELGHAVEPADPPWHGAAMADAFTTLFAPLVMLGVARAAALRGREPGPDDLEPLSWALWQRVRSQSSLEAAAAANELQRFARVVLTWMDDYDAILTPALAEAPPALAELDWRTDDPLGLFDRSAAFTPFTAVANVTGQPAIALPLLERDGLPLGVQLLGRPAREGALLALAGQLEAAQPWAARRPPALAP